MGRYSVPIGRENILMSGTWRTAWIERKKSVRRAYPDHSENQTQSESSTIRILITKPGRNKTGLYFTSQVSPARSSFPRSPGPRLAMTSLICSFITSSADALVAVLPENQRLAIFELDDVLDACIFFGQGEPRAIIEDVAILQNQIGRAHV